MVMSTAQNAMARPASAATSSPVTTINSDSRVSRNHLQRDLFPDVLQISRNAPAKEKASSTTDIPSTTSATIGLLTTSCRAIRCTPSYTENAPPTKNSSSATSME